MFPFGNLNIIIKYLNLKELKTVMADITLAQLLDAGVHFGHKAYRWNPKMFPYIYTERNNIHILDLVQSAQLLKEEIGRASCRERV